MQIGQVGAVCQGVQVLGLDIGREAAQDVSAALTPRYITLSGMYRGTHTENHIIVMEAAIPHHQHIWLYRAQHAEAAHALACVQRPEASIDDAVRATLAQVDASHLGEGAIAAVGVVATKVGRVLRRVRHVFDSTTNKSWSRFYYFSSRLAK